MSQVEAGGYKHRWLVLTVVLIAEMMDLLDSTIVNVGGPALAQKLHATSTDLQWVIGGYALALGSGLILGGRLGDRFGRRNMFLFGLIGFTLASLACAFAPTVLVLIVLRFVQGFLGAMLLPQGFGLIREAFPPAEFGKAFAAYGPAFGLGGILGPIIGGFLIQANIFDLGWRAVFLVNVPIGIVAALISFKYLQKSTADKTIKIDIFGALLVMVASGLLVYPLIKGQEAGWPLWTYLMLIGSVAAFLLFAKLEFDARKKGKTSLIDPTIFKKRAYTFGLGGLGLYFAGFTGIYLILTLFLQFGEQFTSSQAGLGNIPIALGSAIGGTISGAFLAEKIGGRYTLQIGATVQVIGIALFLVRVAGPSKLQHLATGAGTCCLGHRHRANRGSNLRHHSFDRRTSAKRICQRCAFGRAVGLFLGGCSDLRNGVLQLRSQRPSRRRLQKRAAGSAWAGSRFRCCRQRFA